MAGEELTRRQLLGAGLAGGAALYGLGGVGPGLRAALAAPAACLGRLEDIEHVVIVMQENRSFDHYFGTFPGVRGFADPTALPLTDGSGLTVFAQPGFDRPGYDGHLFPFHVDSRKNGECTHDITHDWGPQHRAWNDGALDGFVREHLAVNGRDNGPLTMGYYRRSDLEYYFALADAFTVCDGFFCSVIGPTDPNRIMAIAGTLDPDGEHGGPLLETKLRSPLTFGSLTMTTMPEQLRARGISWKVYSAPDNLEPEGDAAFSYFRQYLTDLELLRRGILPTFPVDFLLDVARGDLPQVSWVETTVVQSEHPPTPPIFGENAVDSILSALTAKPDLWAKTVVFITHDENGGFFDHVPPPTPPPGTEGEYVTVPNLPAAAQGIRGPIGLGFRVPLLVVSPFSRGGFVCSDTFDHTSLLRFLETRFGAEVPNLSAWRRSVTGDLTSTLNLAAPDASVPSLPKPSIVDRRVILSECLLAPAGLVGVPVPPYPVPPNSMPEQEPGQPQRPSGLDC